MHLLSAQSGPVNRVALFNEKSRLVELNMVAKYPLSRTLELLERSYLYVARHRALHSVQLSAQGRISCACL